MIGAGREGSSVGPGRGWTRGLVPREGVFVEKGFLGGYGCDAAGCLVFLYLAMDMVGSVVCAL